MQHNYVRRNIIVAIIIIIIIIIVKVNIIIYFIKMLSKRGRDIRASSEYTDKKRS